jgi:hypothetical protein
LARRRSARCDDGSDADLTLIVLAEGSAGRAVVGVLSIEDRLALRPRERWRRAAALGNASRLELIGGAEVDGRWLKFNRNAPPITQLFNGQRNPLAQKI